MDPLSSSTKPYYSSAALSNIEQRLEPRGLSSLTENTLTGILDDSDQSMTSPLHSAWGEWLTWWDAINLMETRLESEDIIRKTFAVEEILYYWHYIPYRGHKDELFNSADMHFSYEDYGEEVLYFGLSADEDNTANAVLVSYLSMPPDDDMPEKDDLGEDNHAVARDILTAADENYENNEEKTEAKNEITDIISEAIRLLFASRKSLPQKLKFFQKPAGNLPVVYNNNILIVPQIAAPSRVV